ncbi:endopeptidase [Cupriavidus metallidurans]|uniref:Bbp19 family protein n=1 Tax=Cupriavidus metallidurans TaxID=119219 RepID=UPI0016483E01|nr:endopeptidase [Cupriavidus metallidurans]
MSYDPLDTRGQERAKADADLRVKLARESEEADLKWLMGSKRGRRIVWRLLEQAGVFRLSFNTNAMQMAFAEGNRSFGNRTLALIHALTPELYPVMVKEATHERNPDDGSNGRNDH